jgi:hypothetical protein
MILETVFEVWSFWNVPPRSTGTPGSEVTLASIFRVAEVDRE